MGGVRATERLLSMTGLFRGQRALEIGCGSGYTTCLMAGKGIEVVAMDIDAGVLARAKARASGRGVSESVIWIQADAHNLPFKDSAFDVVIAESVLAYCDAGRVCGEAYRVIKPGGAMGVNELTCLRPPDPVLKAFMRRGFGVSAIQEREWTSTMKMTGFTDVISGTYSIRLTGQFLNKMKIDGLRRTMATAWQFINPPVASVKINPKVLVVALKYRSYVGYGLYAGKKHDS